MQLTLQRVVHEKGTNVAGKEVGIAIQKHEMLTIHGRSSFKRTCTHGALLLYNQSPQRQPTSDLPPG